jgi:DNA-binding MurR/RpiR family transcriptional regulator
MLAGFETVAALAKRANVSVPTVVRFIARLGYSSYTDFQRELLREMEARGTSPLSLYHRAEARPGVLLEQSATAFSNCMSETFRRLSVADFEFAVTALAERRNHIFITGGRFTRLLADMLHLHLFRSARMSRHCCWPAIVDQLLDVDRAVLVAHDFGATKLRRCTRGAPARTTVIVITDPWNSPAAQHADAVPRRKSLAIALDPMVPACALTEALIAELMCARPRADCESRPERLREG